MLFKEQSTWCVVIFVQLGLSSANFVIPDVVFEALQPKGFKASIKASPGIELFAFHANKNTPIELKEPGDYGVELRRPKDGSFTYVNRDVALETGDKIYYWIFIQHEQSKYDKGQLVWTFQDTSKTCGNNNNCDNFEDEFDGGTINEFEWIVHQYIPQNPDYEFVNYKKDSNIVFLKNGKLHIKPEVEKNEDQLRKTVDLTDGCTKSDISSCTRSYGGFYQNPITSGRLETKRNFTFESIDIKALLPKGNWIYPQIYLEDIYNSTKKIWVAYARGNAELIGGHNNDLGGRLLFGGVVSDTSEPGRSKYLSTKRFEEPVYATSKKFTVRWTDDDGLLLYVDDQLYGHITKKRLRTAGFEKTMKVKLVLGVGVGGINDFPDGFTSGIDEKPWENRERKQVKRFYHDRTKWLSTWDDMSQLVVDYVKINK